MNRVPSFAEVHRHYAAAAKSIRLPSDRSRGGTGDVHGYDDERRSRWRRLVSVDFHRRLREAGIYVEGAS